MIKIRFLLLLGVLSYIACLLVLFPMAQTSSKVERLLSEWVEVKKTDGNLLSGSAYYKALKIPSAVADGTVKWLPSLIPLLRLQLGGELDFAHAGLQLSSVIGRGLKGVTASHIDGTVDARFINHFLEQSGSQLSGEFTLSDLKLTFSLDQNQWVAAEGNILYSGGKMVVNQNGQAQQPKRIDLPALRGALAINDKGAVSIEVKPSESESLLVHAVLQSDGWGQLKVYKSFLKLTGFGKVHGSETDTFLDIKQRIF